jgi:hypothetical protein
VRIPTDIKKLDDCFGDFLVRVTCKCGAELEVTPEARARLVGSSMTLKELAQRTVHCILGHAGFATTMKLYGGLTAEALEPKRRPAQLIVIDRAEQSQTED